MPSASERVAHRGRAPLRELDVGRVVAGAIGEAGHVDRIRAGLHRRRETLQQAQRFGVERGLAGREMDDQRRAGEALRRARAPALPGFGTYGVALTGASGARRNAPSTTT